MNIKQNLITEHNNFKKGRAGHFPVDRVVIHVEEGSESATDEWFDDPISHVSAHYGNNKLGVIEQFVDEADTAYSNGRVASPTAKVVLQRVGVNPNDYTISIEHEGDGTQPLTDAQKTSTVELLCDIWHRNLYFLMDRDHVLGHHEIYINKTCPGKIDVDELITLANKKLSE
jgi:N-acetylmuramoyl-L-alanine amidase